MTDNHAEKVKHWTRMLEQDPKNVNAYILRGYARFMERDYHGTIQDLSSAVKLDPSCQKDVQPWLEKAQQILKNRNI